MLIQLELFENKTEIEVLEEKLFELEKSVDKTRKALFARHGDLAKRYLEINERLQILEMNICKGK
jgi:hypothetical protein